MAVGLYGFGDRQQVMIDRDDLVRLVAAVRSLPELQRVIQEGTEVIRDLREEIGIERGQRTELEKRVDDLVAATGLLGYRIEEQNGLVENAMAQVQVAEQRTEEERRRAAEERLQAQEVQQGLQHEVEGQRQVNVDRLDALYQEYLRYQQEEDDYLQAGDDRSISGVFEQNKFLVGSATVAATEVAQLFFPPLRYVSEVVKPRLVQEGEEIIRIRCEIGKLSQVLGREPPKMRQLMAEEIAKARLEAQYAQ